MSLTYISETVDHHVIDHDISLITESEVDSLPSNLDNYEPDLIVSCTSGALDGTGLNGCVSCEHGLGDLNEICNGPYYVCGKFASDKMIQPYLEATVHAKCLDDGLYLYPAELICDKQTLTPILDIMNYLVFCVKSCSYLVVKLRCGVLL